MNFGDITTNDDTSIAEHFNAFFVSIGRDTSEKIPPVNTNFKDYLPNPCNNSMFFDPVDIWEIQRIINKLKPKLSSGFDDISCKLLKLSSAYILEPLTHIVNISLSNGEVPSQMKIAKVIPIEKNETTLLLQTIDQ